MCDYMRRNRVDFLIWVPLLILKEIEDQNRLHESEISPKVVVVMWQIIEV
jgi:hypothetical protein